MSKNDEGGGVSPPREGLRPADKLPAMQSVEMAAILRDMPISVVRLDSRLRYVYANHTHARRLGKSEGELVGLPWYEAVPASLREEFEPYFQQARAGVKTEFSFSYRNHEGKLKSVDAVVTIQRGKAGQEDGVLAMFIDTTEREDARRKLLESVTELKEMRAALDAHAIVAVTDARGVITRVNEKFCQISKYSREELLGQTHRIINSGHHPREFFVDLWRTIAAGSVWTGEVCNRNKEGGLYWVHTTIVSFLSDEGRPVQYIAIRADITSRKLAEQRAQELAYYDPLTGLPNRRLMADRMRTSVAASKRSTSLNALIMLDLDNFKDINDSQGHDQGDELLRQVASRLSKSVREGDTVARLGGDEFVVLIDGLNSSASVASIEAHGIAEKIRQALELPFDLNGQIGYTSSSIGISIFGAEAQRTKDVLKQADIALYRSKERGKNQACLFSPALQAEVEAHSSLMFDLRKALGNDEFKLLYQVVVNGDQQPEGYEALLRWVHPVRGSISPHDFIGKAEQSGLIIEIGQWVLETACRQLATWARNPDASHLTVAVNISARQLRDPDFDQTVERALASSGANPRLLRLELTESMFHTDVEQTIGKMERLKQLGVRFSLDDFGTGYSSLSYLKRLPLDQLKIDKSFVTDLLSDSNDAAIAKTILALAKTLGLKVVAEGVELAEQFEFLKSNRCDAFQGYLFGKPEAVGQSLH